ncbi:MAG: PH domain-containing protein [Bacilli bacterium]
MAYIKYKELTQYFNFYKDLTVKELPDYVWDYIGKSEDVIAAYSTLRDKAVFTTKEIIIFDQRGMFGKSKKIMFFPYNSISSNSIEYKEDKTILLFVFDSGYQMRLNFIKMSAERKTEIRKLFFQIKEKCSK